MSGIPSLAPLRAFTRAERRLLLLAAILMPCYSAGVRLCGLRGVHGWFRGVKVPAGATPAQAARIVGALARRVPWKGACLPAALTLQRLLHAQGVGSELRLGVRRHAGRIEAHAWLEREGAVLLDTRGAGEAFAALDRAGRS